MVPGAPDIPDPAAERLLCLVDVLCLRSRDPALAGRGPFKPAVALLPSLIAPFDCLPPGVW